METKTGFDSYTDEALEAELDISLAELAQTTDANLRTFYAATWMPAIEDELQLRAVEVQA